MKRTIIALFFVGLLGAEAQAKNAFVDKTSGALKAFGFVDANGAGDTKINVPDDFNLEPNKWQWDGSKFIAYTPPPPPLPKKTVDLKAAMDALIADPTSKQALIDFVSALKATLP